MKRINALLVACTVAMLAACGGGGSETAAAPPTVARVEIRETGLLLTAVGASRQLTAVVTDEQGQVVDVGVSWSSTNAAAVGVDSNGRVTANAATGSAQITAQARGVPSAPLLVAVTTPATGTVLLTDAQIVGDPVASDPSAAPSFANTYRVVLSGVAAPAIGQRLVNTESKVVAGEVVAVASSGATHTVTLKLVPARVLLPGLNLNETIDLSRAAVEFAPDIAAAYDIVRSGHTYTFTPKPKASGSASPRARALAAQGTHALPPFTSCESTLNALPIALDGPPLFNLTIDPALDVLFTAANGVERLIVRAEPVVRVQAGLNVTAAFEGKIECKVELFAIRIPVGGALSLVVGGLVPVGVGIEAGGKVTVATLAIGARVEAKAKAQIGLTCPGGGGCGFVGELSDTSLQYAPTLDLPSLGDLRVEPTLMAFGYFGAEIGNPFLRQIRFDAFKARAGGKLAGSFAPKISQITDTGYKSDYKVSLEARAGVGLDLGDVLGLLGLESLSSMLERTISTDLARSPVGTVMVDRSSFAAGDTVRFTVQFDPAHKDFFSNVGPYNIQRVLLVRRNGLEATVVASAAASAGQTEFTIPFTATGSGSASEFSAFVVTSLMPAELLALEVAQPRSIWLADTPERGCLLDPGNPCGRWWVNLAAVTAHADFPGALDPVPGLSVSVTGDACIAPTASSQTNAQGAFTIAWSPAGSGTGCAGNVHLVLAEPGGGVVFETDLVGFDFDDE